MSRDQILDVQLEVVRHLGNMDANISAIKENALETSRSLKSVSERLNALERFRSRVYGMFTVLALLAGTLFSTFKDLIGKHLWP